MTRDEALRQAQVVAAALGIGPVALLGIAFVIPANAPAGSALVYVAMIAGIVAPAIAWRIYGAIRGSGPSDEAARCRRFVVSVAGSLAATEAAALLGIVAYSLTRDPKALVGMLTHVAAAGALWPSRERLDLFVEAGANR